MISKHPKIIRQICTPPPPPNIYSQQDRPQEDWVLPAQQLMVFILIMSTSIVQILWLQSWVDYVTKVDDTRSIFWGSRERQYCLQRGRESMCLKGWAIKNEVTTKGWSNLMTELLLCNASNLYLCTTAFKVKRCGKNAALPLFRTSAV